MDIENARQDPDLFLDNHPPPLVLDEIQYAPELVPALKRRIDRNRSPGQYLITGSQQWSVMKSLAESLAGRVVFLDLDGFSLGELARAPAARSWLSLWLEDPKDFFRLIGTGPSRLHPLSTTLYEQLWRGFLPDAAQIPLETVPDYFQGYLRTYIERDARMLLEASDWQQFTRFVRLVAAMSGAEINHSQLGRDIGVTPQTAKRWLATLTATFQWFELPAFSGNAIKRISGKTRGFFADVGFASFLQAISSPAALSSHPRWGSLFETAVYGEIRKLCAPLSSKPIVYHWRTQGGAEVDLLLERDGRLYPIEIKSKSHPSGRDARGIGAFRQTYPTLDVQPGLVIAPCDHVIHLTDRDLAIPWNLSMTEG